MKTTASGLPAARIARWGCDSVGDQPWAGDANADHTVDFEDLMRVLGNFGEVMLPPAPGDVTGEGAVDCFDLNAVLGMFGTTCN